MHATSKKETKVYPITIFYVLYHIIIFNQCISRLITFQYAVKNINKSQQTHIEH